MCLCESLSSKLGRLSWQSDLITLSSLSSSGVDLAGGDSLISLVNLSICIMMTLLSARRLRFCSLIQAFSCLQCRNYQFPASSRARNWPYNYYTRTRSPRAYYSRFYAIPYHLCAAYNYFLTRERSLQSTAMVRSYSDSIMAFFYYRASRSFVRCLIKRTAQSLSQGGASRGGVERRESPLVLAGDPLARLPMILPSDRLRLALQTDIY